MRHLFNRQNFEYAVVGIIGFGWLVKLFFWFTPINVLTKLGIHKNYIVLETLISMLVGGALVILIYYQRQHYSSPKMLWGSAVGACTLATAQLLVILVIGLVGLALGLEGHSL